MAVDLRDVTAEHLADVGADAVVHLGALCNDPLGNLNPSLTYDVNHLATVRLAEAAKAAGVDALPVRVVVQPVRRGGKPTSRSTKRPTSPR